MTAEKLCYFTVVAGRSQPGRVRYGFARRADCLVEVDRQRWELIAARLRQSGYRLIEWAGGCGGRAQAGKRKG